MTAPIPLLPMDQPFASWLFEGIAAGMPPIKRIETRGKGWEHRGFFAVHATAKKIDARALNKGNRAIHRATGRVPVLTRPMGAIIGLAEITECVQMDRDLIAAQTALELAVGIWEVGRWAWIIGRTIPFAVPVPHAAHQGLNYWTPNADAQRILAEAA